MGVLPKCVLVHHLRKHDPLGLEIQMAVSCHVGDGI